MLQGNADVVYQERANAALTENALPHLLRSCSPCLFLFKKILFISIELQEESSPLQCIFSLQARGKAVLQLGMDPALSAAGIL